MYDGLWWVRPDWWNNVSGTLIWMGLCYYLGLSLYEWGNSVGRALV